MKDTTGMIAQVKAGTFPQEWSIFRAQLDSVWSVLVAFALLFIGMWLLGGAIWGLFPSVWQHLFSSSLDIPFGWWFLAESLLVLVPAAYLLIRPWFWPSMVIITDEEAIEYLPERWFRRVQIFDFATIQGMVVHVHDTYGETNMHISTQYSLQLRDAQGKEQRWSFTRLYGPGKRETGAVYAQVVKHFERRHTNHTEGLSTSSTYYIRD